MTFEEILDQAIAMLQRRGRLTYRALQRQFDLDDDYLQDLKTELIQGQRLAIDEEGDGWDGRAPVHQRPGFSTRGAAWHLWGATYAVPAPTGRLAVP
jgi:hypothetical protein